MKMPTRTNLNLTLLIIKNIYLSKKMALYANFHRFERNNLTLHLYGTGRIRNRTEIGKYFTLWDI